MHSTLHALHCLLPFFLDIGQPFCFVDKIVCFSKARTSFVCCCSCLRCLSYPWWFGWLVGWWVSCSPLSLHSDWLLSIGKIYSWCWIPSLILVVTPYSVEDQQSWRAGLGIALLHAARGKSCQVWTEGGYTSWFGLVRLFRSGCGLLSCFVLFPKWFSYFCLLGLYTWSQSTSSGTFTLY